MIKNIFILVLILFNINSFRTFGQNNEDLILELYSNNLYESVPAINAIIDQKVNEALPDLIALYESKPYVLKQLFLKALFMFGDPNIHNRTIEFIDNVDSSLNEEFPVNPLLAKVDATGILFSLQDYSTYNYIFDLVNRDGISSIHPAAFHLLNQILKHVPAGETQAKNILLELWQLSTNDYFRYFSMIFLVEKYGTEMMSEIIDTFENDPDLSNRVKALKLLFENDYSGINSLLKNHLILELEWPFRIDIADTLLQHFGEPSDYKAVIDYQPNEPNETARSLMGYSIQGFIPPRQTVSTSVMINNLISYTQELFQYGWITEQVTFDKYTDYFNTTKDQITQGDSSEARSTLEIVLHDVDIDSGLTLTREAYVFLHYNTEYLIEQLPKGGESISTYSIFATHSIWLKQSSDILSGSVGVNEAGVGPFLDSQLELSVGKGTTTLAGYTIKANRIKVKQNATVNADVYYNELDNNGTITGTLNTPLELPLFTTLPEFHTSTPGTEDIIVPQNGEYTLTPGAYGEIQVKKNGKLIFTGGEYNIITFNGGDNNQLLFQGESEVKIADKFETGQGSYIGPADTTTLSAKDIVFYVEGINGNNGNLGATPKAAKVGLNNTVFANFYVPNGTLWLRQNSEVEGAFIGKDVIVGLSVQVKLKSAF